MCSNHLWWSVFRWHCVGHVSLLSLCSLYVLPHERESRAVLDSGFHAADSRFQVTAFQSLSMELGFWIPIDCVIPDSTPWIPDSGWLDSSLCQWNLDSGFQSTVWFRIPWAVFWIPKTQDSRFQKPKFSRFRNPDSLTLGDMSGSFCARTKIISGRASVHTY